MIKSFIKIVVSLFFVASALHSCSVDKSYDLNKKFDNSINVGKQVLVPIGNYPTIRIGDLLSKKAKEEVFIKDLEGEYYVTNTGGKILKNYEFGHYEVMGLSVINLNDFGIPELKFYLDIQNTLPFDYDLSAFVVDSTGKRIEDIIAIIEASLPKGSEENPSYTPAVLTISSSMTQEGIGFDGFYIVLNAKEIAAEPVKIHHSQGLALKDVKAQLPEGINLKIKKKKNKNQED